MERLCGQSPSSMPAMKTTGNSRPFALCSVSSDTAAPLVELVGVGNQRRVVQELRDALAALGGLGGGVQQFLKVLQTRFGVGRGALLEHAPVARSFQHVFENRVQRLVRRPPGRTPR